MTTLPFCPVEGKPFAKRPKNKRRKVVAKRIEGATPSNNDNIEADADADTTTAPVINADADTVEVGREAWERIKTNGRKTWPDWLEVGAAALVGRQEALNVANKARPQGKQYNQAFSAWLKDTGFDEIDSSDRNDLFKIMDNLEEIEEWRAGLTPEQQAKWNHPSTVWRVSHCKDRGMARCRSSVKPTNNDSAESEHGSEATTPHDAGDDEHHEKIGWQRGLLQRANRAIGDAQLHGHWLLPEPPDPWLITQVRWAADSWAELAATLESIANASPKELAEEGVAE